MKARFAILTLVVVLLLTFGMASIALADGPNPPTPPITRTQPTPPAGLQKELEAKTSVRGGGGASCMPYWVGIQGPLMPIEAGQPISISIGVAAYNQGACDPALFSATINLAGASWPIVLQQTEDGFKATHNFVWMEEGNKEISVVVTYGDGWLLTNRTTIRINPGLPKIELLGDYGLACGEGYPCELWIVMDREPTPEELSWGGIPIALVWYGTDKYQILILTQEITKFSWVYNDDLPFDTGRYIDLWTLGMGSDWKWVWMINDDIPFCPVPTTTPTPATK